MTTGLTSRLLGPNPVKPGWEVGRLAISKLKYSRRDLSRSPQRDPVGGRKSDISGRQNGQIRRADIGNGELECAIGQHRDGAQLGRDKTDHRRAAQGKNSSFRRVAANGKSHRRDWFSVQSQSP